MSEELLVTFMPHEDGSGVDVEMAGDISAKPLIIGTVMMAAKVCKLTGLSPDEFWVLFKEGMKKVGESDGVQDSTRAIDQ